MPTWRVLARLPIVVSSTRPRTCIGPTSAPTHAAFAANAMRLQDRDHVQRHRGEHQRIERDRRGHQIEGRVAQDSAKVGGRVSVRWACAVRCGERLGSATWMGRQISQIRAGIEQPVSRHPTCCNSVCVSGQNTVLAKPPNKVRCVIARR
jgi:hypothetical protein